MGVTVCFRCVIDLLSRSYVAAYPTLACAAAIQSYTLKEPDVNWRDLNK